MSSAQSTSLSEENFFRYAGAIQEACNAIGIQTSSPNRPEQMVSWQGNPTRVPRAAVRIKANKRYRTKRALLDNESKCFALSDAERQKQ